MFCDVFLKFFCTFWLTSETTKSAAEKSWFFTFFVKFLSFCANLPPKTRIQVNTFFTVLRFRTYNSFLYDSNSIHILSNQNDDHSWRPVQGRSYIDFEVTRTHLQFSLPLQELTYSSHYRYKNSLTVLTTVTRTHLQCSLPLQELTNTAHSTLQELTNTAH